MSTASIVLDIIGRDRASKAFDQVGKSAAGAGSKSASFGKLAAAGLASAGAAAIAFGKSSVDKFEQVSGETAKLQRYMGGTSEAASRMRFAAQESGVEFDTLTKSIGLMSKHTAVGDKAMAAAGVSFRDATGKMRPTTDVMNSLADKFASMQNGPLKTALAMKIFGKSGADMLPMLSKGSKGIKELAQESDELGNTISGKDTASVKANIVAKRKWHAAIDGIQIMLGRKLFPALLKVQLTLARVAVWVNKNSRVIGPLAKVVLGLVGAAFILVKVTKAYTAVQAALNVVLEMNPIGLVVLAIVGLVAALVFAYKNSETFRNIVNGAFHAVLTVVKSVFSWIKGNWPTLLIILTGVFGLAVVLIIKHWTAIKNAAIAAVNWFRGLPAKITSAISGLWNAITDKWTSMRTSLGIRTVAFISWVGGIPGRVTRTLGAIWSAVTDRWNAMRNSLGIRAGAFVSWVAGLPGRVTRYLGGIWSAITDRWNAMRNSLGDRAGAFVSWVGGLPGRVSRNLGAIWYAILEKWQAMRNSLGERAGAFVSWVAGLPGKMANATRGLFNGIWASFKANINNVIGAWNNLSFTIGGGSIAGIAIPELRLDTPNLNYLAKGGIVTRPTLAMIGEAGPEAVIPLNRSGGGASADDRPIIVQVMLDGQMVHQVLVRRKRNLGRELGLA